MRVFPFQTANDGDWAYDSKRDRLLDGLTDTECAINDCVDQLEALNLFELSPSQLRRVSAAQELLIDVRMELLGALYDRV